MGIIEWAISPWGQTVPIHIAWFLIWVAAIAGLSFLIVHVIYASFWLDFWSIWPDKVDLQDAGRRTLRFIGRRAAPPRKFAKYPLDNKLYHLAIVATGLSAILTGVFMLSRVRTIFLPR